MNKHFDAEDPQKNLDLLQENHEDEYWAKKYGVSKEDLKKTSNKLDISSKILEVNFKKKAYSF
jgi:hypothetical protein